MLGLLSKILIGFVFLFFINCTSHQVKEEVSQNQSETWLDKLKEKQKVRFQVPVFEIENLSRENKIHISQEFANLWTKYSNFDAVVIDETIKKKLMQTNRSIPSYNFSIRSETSGDILRLLVVDLETGEILTYGKVKILNKEEIPAQLEEVIKNQMIVAR